MISSRKYFVSVMLFATAFVMFMCVNIATGNFVSKDIDDIGFEKIPKQNIEMLNASNLEQKDDMLIDSNLQKIAIIVDDENSQQAIWAKEWCTYRKFVYQVFVGFPNPEQVEDFSTLIIGDMPISKDDLPILNAYTETKRDIIFTKLPSFDDMKNSKALADYFGIRSCVEDNYELDSIHILKGFLASDERIYNKDSMYDDSENESFSAPYYLLKSGYEVFVQGVPSDTSVHYYDYPSLLWRALTNEANIYAVNTDIFDSKSMIGIYSAFVSQTKEYDVYPIINAQSVSVLNYPLLCDENEKQMQSMYSRGAQSLSRDTLWPAIDKILLTYDAGNTFFMSPQLDYEDSEDPSPEMMDFYSREIKKRMGVLGVSFSQTSNVPLNQKLAEDNKFYNENMNGKKWYTAYATKAELDEFEKINSKDLGFSDLSVFITEYFDNENVVSVTNDGACVVSVTDDGFKHTIKDDIRMICLETALGLYNQQVDMAKVYYPQNEGDNWNYFSSQWSKAITYLKDFESFDKVDSYGLGEKTVNFMSIKYDVEKIKNGISLNIDSIDKSTSFILKLNNKKIKSVKNAEYKKLNDSTYVLNCSDSNVEIIYDDINVLDDKTMSKMEVVK